MQAKAAANALQSTAIHSDKVPHNQARDTPACRTSEMQSANARSPEMRGHQMSPGVVVTEWSLGVHVPPLHEGVHFCLKFLQLLDCACTRTTHIHTKGSELPGCN